MSKEVAITIDGTELRVPEGTTILAAAQKLGIQIPTLCHKDGLEPFTSCFLCVVEVAGRPNPVPSCATAVQPGMVISTATDRIRDTRKLCLELLLSDHCGDCMAPCTITCPAGCDVQEYMRAIAEADDGRAIRVIKDTLPIPGALGRICPRPCEGQCRRVRVEEPLAICWSHRYAADVDAASGRTFTPPSGPDSGQRVAVIGAGPAGMAAAYFLRQYGHRVTVFEAKSEPGGMLRWGIPAYRLPRPELARELQAIVEMGVEMRYGQALGRDVTIAGLKEAGYDGIFVAVGAPLSSSMRTPGEDLPGVLPGIDFLDRAAHGEQVPVGQRVVVVGGGNTAIDAVRTARRLGASEVTLLYRRTRAEMPALPIEIQEAEQEGTSFRFLAAPVSIERENNSLVINCQQMELGEVGPDGRRKPVPVKDGLFKLPADTVIPAIGQRIDVELLIREGLVVDERKGTLVVNPHTHETNLPGVFAGGDSVAQDAQKIAVWAVGSGRVAAICIDQYLRGDRVTGRETKFRVSMGAAPAEVSAARFAGIPAAARAKMPELELAQRVTTFREVELGLTNAQAREEAKRCLACGCAVASTCVLRRYALEYGANPARVAGATRDYDVDASHPEIIIEPGKCINCGICVRMCDDREGLGLFGFIGRGFETRITAYFCEDSRTRDLAAACADACPTGALVNRSDLGRNVCFGCGRRDGRLPVIQSN